MAKYHINAKGEPGLCKARTSCPFGDFKTEHYSSADEAREAYETFAHEYFIAKDRKKDVAKGQGELFTLEEVENLNTGAAVEEDPFHSAALEMIKDSDDDHDEILSKLSEDDRKAVGEEHDAFLEGISYEMEFSGKKLSDLEAPTIKMFLQNVRAKETQIAKVFLLAQNEDIEIIGWDPSVYAFEDVSALGGETTLTYDTFSGSVPTFYTDDKQLAQRYKEVHGEDANYRGIRILTL